MFGSDRARFFGHLRAAWAAVVLSGAVGCASGTLDAGADKPHGPLPVDERNAILLCNDGYQDNWQGEYALLFASSGVRLAGIIVKDSTIWANLGDNLAGWQSMVTAARSSGIQNIPDPIGSVGPVLVEPADGAIDSTHPNGSDGAHLIIEASKQLSLPYRPLVVAVGTRLTDVADAYLLDPTTPERVVVVASLGSGAADGGTMGFPNGDLDPWADWIVAQKFRYVQASAYYDQSADVPSSRLSELPNNAFGAWMSSKQAYVANQVSMWGDTGDDQVSVLASALPSFVLEVERTSQSDASSSGSSSQVPVLGPNTQGEAWLVTASDGTVAASRLWQMLLNPKTFGP
jgi:hypothetical protein